MPALPLTNPVYVFGVLMLILLLAPIIAGRLRVPALVMLILLGCLLGSNGLGVISRDSSLVFFEKIGLLYIMLLAGLQMDLSNLKQLGLRSLILGLLTFSVPFMVGILTGHLMAVGGLTAILLGLLYSPHTLLAYPTLARLNLMQREVIGVAVGGTVITSVLTLAGFSIVQAAAQGQVGPILWLKLLLGLPLIALVSVWSIPKVGAQILQKTASTTPFIFVLATLFVLGSATQLLGVDSIVGAFIAGLTLNRLIPFSSELMKQIEFVGNSLFIPIFMVSVGVLANPQILIRDPSNLGIALGVISGAVGAKFIAAWIASRWLHYSRFEMLTMFSLTIPRAALVLVIALFGQQANLISAGLFNAVVAYILITCLLGPLLSEYWGQRLIATIDTVPG
ncbi:MAG: cation:proton antiporter [Thermosynechococcaceae cyanobacterium]